MPTVILPSHNSELVGQFVLLDEPIQGVPLIGIDHETVIFTELTATGFGERGVKTAAYKVFEPVIDVAIQFHGWLRVTGSAPSHPSDRGSVPGSWELVGCHPVADGGSPAGWTCHITQPSPILRSIE
jgi:hypothetical protein